MSDQYQDPGGPGDFQERSLRAISNPKRAGLGALVDALHIVLVEVARLRDEVDELKKQGGA